jgi:hypothetical protein
MMKKEIWERSWTAGKVSDGILGETSLMTQDHTHVPASMEVCGSVERKRLAYAWPAMTEKDAMARQTMNHRKRSQEEGMRRNVWPKKLFPVSTSPTPHQTHVSCTTGWAWR